MGSLNDGVKRLTESTRHHILPQSTRLALVNLGNQSMKEAPTRVWQSHPATSPGGISGSWVEAPAFGPMDSHFHVASMQFSLHYMFQTIAQVSHSQIAGSSHH